VAAAASAPCLNPRRPPLIIYKCYILLTPVHAAVDYFLYLINMRHRIYCVPLCNAMCTY